MKKNTKIIIAIGAALVFSVLTVLLIIQILTPQRATIYVFNDNYGAGSTLSSNMFTSIQVDSNIVSLGVKNNVNQRFVTQAEYADIIRSGDSLKIDVGKGMPLMQSMLSVAGGNAIEMLMKPSAIAVTISVNGVRGVTNDLSAGSRVNVYYTGTNGTQLLFENMRVLGVTKTSSGALAAASLEATHAEAALLINAAENGSLYLGLVNANGYQYLVTDTPTPSTESPTPAPTPELTDEPTTTDAISAPDNNQ